MLRPPTVSINANIEVNFPQCHSSTSSLCTICKSEKCSSGIHLIHLHFNMQFTCFPCRFAKHKEMEQAFLACLTGFVGK